MKKILKFYLIFCFSLNLLSVKGQNYCTYLGYTDEGHYIHNFALAEIANLHTGGEYSYPAYTDYSNQFTATLVAGKTYNMVVGAGMADISFSAWIDYDHNSAFSNAERINYTPTILANNLAVLSFTVPSNATLGNTRLRIVSDFDATPSNFITPCQNAGYGEAEDYMVNILADTATTNCANAVQIAATPMCGTQNSNLFVTNAVSGVAYSWSNGANASQINVNQAGIYAVSAYDSACAVTTYDTIEVVAHPTSSIALTSSSISECILNNISIYISGANVSYVWDGADNAYYSNQDTIIITPSFATYHDIYLWAADSFGCVVNDTITVDFYDYYIDDIYYFDTEICDGSEVPMTLASDGYPNVTFQWYKNGVPIPGATNGSYSAQSTGLYDCAVDYHGECWVGGVSQVYVTIYDMSSLFVTATPNTAVPYGDSVLLSCSACSGCTYNWIQNGSYIPNASSSIYYATTSGDYSVEVMAGICYGTAMPVSVSIGGNAIDNMQISGLSGYPNPAHNIYKISWQNFEKVSILLYDKMGKKIFQTTAEDTQYSLNMEEYTAGVYFAKITTSDGKTASMQIVKD